jgi:hypothetical protein
MHAIACGVLLLLAAQDADRRRAADEGWAREVATHFLDAAFSLNDDEALALATKGFRKRLRQRYPGNESRGLREITVDVFWEAKKAGIAACPIVRRVVVSPDGSEARITGEVRIGQGDAERTLAHFSAMLSKSPGGRWQVNGLSAKLLTPAAASEEPCGVPDPAALSVLSHSPVHRSSLACRGPCR